MKCGDIIFKGTKDGLVLVIPEEGEVSSIKELLREKLSGTNNFFAGAQTILDFGNRRMNEGSFQEICKTVQDYGLKVIKAIGSFGTIVIEEAPEESEPHPVSVPPGFPGEAAQVAIPPERTLLVKRTFRSGQGTSHPGNIVILGDVNPGAEVVAGGDIIVVGALRGVAHAGAPSNPSAIVMALHLSPTQLRIADLIARAPDIKKKASVTPEVASVKGGIIVIEPYPL